MTDILSDMMRFKSLVKDFLSGSVFRLTSGSSPSHSTTSFLYSSLAKEGPCPLVLCGPSGSGKSTVMKKLMAEYGEFFGFSVSHTTRNPRPGEVDGKDYHYTTREKMQELVDAGSFIENATFSGNMYGTSKEAVQHVLENGKICILDIDVQGVKAVKKTDLKPRFVFIKPPSMEVLEERLRARATESEESLAKRLGAAAAEMEYGETKGNFDVIIINDDLENAYVHLRDFIMPDINAIKAKSG